MSDSVFQRLKSALAGRYDLVGEVARGGMGTVFEAQDLKHRRAVAIKVLNPDLAAAIGEERFQAEIQTAARLTHPHIVPLHDSGAADRLLYYVMPLIAGESLRERLRRERQLPVEDALRIAREASDALHYAHGQGLIHRDVKPENILLSGGHALVLDFGIARTGSAPAGTATQTLAIAGTPTYMSPEQTSGGPIDARSDQYSLACVLYEMLAGQPPFTGASADSIALQHRTLEPRPVTALRPTAPPAVVQAIARALAKAPADRYPSIATFAEALGALTTPTGVRRDTPTPSGLPGGRVMLAVLPLENLSADPEQEFFTDGMTEELIAHLGRLQPKRLGVIARTSAMRYKKTPKSVEEIGRELGVDHVLEGSIRRAGDRVRITAQLIQVADQTHLWAESYDRRVADVFDLQSEVAAAVAKALEVELLPSGKAQGSAAAAANSVAYEWYLKGRFHWNRRTKEGFDRAIECFEHAIAADPTYARGHAGLAGTYAVLPVWGYVPSRDALAKAESLAKRALELDPNLAEAHASYGAILSNRYGDFEGSEREARRAMELDPGSATAFSWCAATLTARGRFEEALRLLEQARRIDPLSVIVSYDMGDLHFLWRRFDEAVRHYAQLVDLEPSLTQGYSRSATAYAALGRYDEALAILAQGEGRCGPSPDLVATRAYVLAFMGRRDEALALGRQLEERVRTEYVPWIVRSFVPTALGDVDAACHAMEMAATEDSFPLAFFRTNPIWDPIRNDPRFEALLGKLKAAP